MHNCFLTLESVTTPASCLQINIESQAIYLPLRYCKRHGSSFRITAMMKAQYMALLNHAKY